MNGLPLVVFEFKSAVREEATVFNAYEQLTIRYRRDIPQLFVYNAFCVISDGVNNKAGSFFAKYDYFYAWRRVEFGDKRIEAEGIESLYSMIQGMFNRKRLLDILKISCTFLIVIKKNKRFCVDIRSIMRHGLCTRTFARHASRMATAGAARILVRRVAARALRCSS